MAHRAGDDGGRLELRLLTILCVVALVTPDGQAHPGRTNREGCHYCRTNYERWGHAYGEIHCHGGGGSSGGSGGSGAGVARSPAPIVDLPVVQPSLPEEPARTEQGPGVLLYLFLALVHVVLPVAFVSWAFKKSR